jgi:tetratricopeptide (TPR) repeat protein
LVQSDLRSNTETFVSLLSHAEELIDAGRVREARRLLAQFVERKQLDGRMLPALAALYLRVGKPDQAIGTMRKAIAEVGMEPDLLNTLGLIFASLGREKESRQQFEEALRLDATNCEALRNLAFTMHRSGERTEAYDLLVRCFHLMPLSAELRLVCGALLELDGHLDEAAACYREVVELSPVCDQVRLASNRLFFLGYDRPEVAFESVMERLERQTDPPSAHRPD